MEATLRTQRRASADVLRALHRSMTVYAHTFKIEHRGQPVHIDVAPERALKGFPEHLHRAYALVQSPSGSSFAFDLTPQELEAGLPYIETMVRWHLDARAR